MRLQTNASVCFNAQLATDALFGCNIRYLLADTTIKYSHKLTRYQCDNMQIEAILTPSRTLNQAVGGSKKRILETLAQLIAEDQPGVNAEEIFQSLIARERLGSTGIGKGIAIPHCRFATNGSTLGALITLQEPVDFDSIDNAPVDIIFAMLVPQNAEASHLQTLASLAEALQQQGYVEKLRSAESNDELYRRAITP